MHPLQISQEVLSKINTKTTRSKLALALDVTEQSIVTYISKNHPNLTRYPALQVIQNETGLTLEQILEPKLETV